MKSVCIIGEVHLPYQTRWYWPGEGDRMPGMSTYFDQETAFSRFEKMTRDIIRTNHVLNDSIDNGGKYTFNISGTFLDQCKWNPDVTRSFLELTDTGNVEFAASPYYHSICSLYPDLSKFKEEVKKHRDAISNMFGITPTTFVNSELILSKHIGEILKGMGFECLISEGSQNILNGYDPVHLYDDHLPTLLRHIDLSEDIENRFSEKEWTGYPLIADKFASWISSMEGDVVTLYFNYDTLAKHHRNESKICKFVRELPQALADHGVEMVTPTEAVRKYKDKIVKLATLKTETTARYGMHSMMGNHMQHLYLNELVIIGQELENIKDVREYDTFKHIYGCLGQSDLLLDMNSNNFQIAYERGVNLFSILSDLRRAIREVKP